MKKKTLLIAGTALLMMLIGGCGKREEINLNDYVVVEYEGYDSMGTAVATLDYKAFKKMSSHSSTLQNRNGIPLS